MNKRGGTNIGEGRTTECCPIHSIFMYICSIGTNFQGNTGRRFVMKHVFLQCQLFSESRTSRKLSQECEVGCGWKETKDQKGTTLKIYYGY